MSRDEERRASLRWEINAQILVQSGDEEPYTVLDLSDSGLCMLGSDALEPG